MPGGSDAAEQQSERTTLGRFVRAGARVVRYRTAREDLRHEWRRRLRGEPPLPEPGPRTLLVVCHGNLCRSPFAGGLLAARLPAARVSSAGLHAADGHPADPTAQRIAAEFDVPLVAHRTRPVTTEQLTASELILAFTGSQAEELARRAPACAPRVRLLGDFLPQPPHGIEDPWGCPEATFRRVFERIDRAANRLVEQLGKLPS